MKRILFSICLALFVATTMLYAQSSRRDYSKKSSSLKSSNNRGNRDVVFKMKSISEGVTRPKDSNKPNSTKLRSVSKRKPKRSENVSMEEHALPPAPPPAPEETDKIFVVVEEPTEFPGGNDALNKYLSKSIRYPEIAQENGIQGRVIVQFVVEKDGSTAHIEVARGVDPALDKEAVRVVKEMPKWKPGKQRGKPVRTKYTLPVVFRLQ